MKELNVIKNIIREQLYELYSGDIESISQHNGKFVESVIVGDYELALIDI